VIGLVDKMWTKTILVKMGGFNTYIALTKSTSMAKNYLILLLSFSLYFTSYSQQLYVELGTTVSSFDYKNSQGQPLDNLLSTTKTYYGMGYRQSINTEEPFF
jgi:hypothetical protein